VTVSTLTSDTRSGRDLGAEARALGPWFHNLHLPDGSQTAPTRRMLVLQTLTMPDRGELEVAPADETWLCEPDPESSNREDNDPEYRAALGR